MKEFVVLKTDLFTNQVTTFSFSTFDDVKSFLQVRKELIRLYGCYYYYRVLMVC